MKGIVPLTILLFIHTLPKGVGVTVPCQQCDPLLDIEQCGHEQMTDEA